MQMETRYNALWDVRVKWRGNFLSQENKHVIGK
jgi:hypothetical protein